MFPFFPATFYKFLPSLLGPPLPGFAWAALVCFLRVAPALALVSFGSAPGQGGCYPTATRPGILLRDEPRSSGLLTTAPAHLRSPIRGLALLLILTLLAPAPFLEAKGLADALAEWAVEGA